MSRFCGACHDDWDDRHDDLGHCPTFEKPPSVPSQRSQEPSQRPVRRGLLLTAEERRVGADGLRAARDAMNRAAAPPGESTGPQ
jgi:hypothetical protein